MIDFILVPIISFFLGLFTDRRRSDHQKDLQILLLRQQCASGNGRSRNGRIFRVGKNLVSRSGCVAKTQGDLPPEQSGDAGVDYLLDQAATPKATARKRL